MTPALPLTLLLLAGAPDAGPSPASLAEATTFFEAAAERLSDAELPFARPQFVTLGPKGQLVFGDDLEFQRCAFTAAPAGAAHALTVTCGKAAPVAARWEWLGPRRARTTLFGASLEVVALRPTPEQRLAALGERRAVAALPAGTYRGRDGGAVVTLGADGGVRWAASPQTPGRFFTCASACGESAVEQLCLRLRDEGGVSAVFVRSDGGLVGRPGLAPDDLCNGLPVWRADLAAPPVLRWAPLSSK